MRTSTYISLSLLIPLILLVSGCEIERYGCTDPNAGNYDVSADIDDGSCDYTDHPIPGQQASNGNLVITNETDKILYLYKDLEYKAIIPAGAENYLVQVDNPDLQICKLQVWRDGDLTNTDNPDLSTVYRQWSVALSNTDNPNERATWLITNSDNYSGSGTLNITYPKIDNFGFSVIYQVDIFLDSKNGAKIASLQPGISNKKISVDYGLHYLYLRYWYSDPNSTSGEIDEIGWEEISDIVINAQHFDADINIPFYYSNVGKHGELKVINSTDFAINIYANDVLIEDIAIVDGPSQSLSTIPAGKSTTFVIPVNKYSISAKLINGSQVGAFSNIGVLEGSTAELNFGVSYRTVSISNNTDQTITLHNELEKYLGLVLKPGESVSNFQVPAGEDSLLVFDLSKMKYNKFGAESSVTIDNLNDYKPTQLIMQSVWNEVGSGYYRSPDIEDNEHTTMEATLIAGESTKFSFEYKVSCEEKYDYFTFILNGTDSIEVSGITDWIEYSTVVEEGTHELLWIYTKDGMYDGGDDIVEIRNIKTE